MQTQKEVFDIMKRIEIPPSHSIITLTSDWHRMPLTRLRHLSRTLRMNRAM